MPENYTPKTDWQKDDIVSEHDFNRIEQGLADAHNPSYIPQTNQAQIFNPPAGSVDGYVKGMEIRGQSWYNLAPNSDLSIDSNSDNIPDGWTITNVDNLSLSDGVLSFTPNSQYDMIYAQIDGASWQAGDIVYFSMHVGSDSGSVVLYINDGVGQTPNSHSGSGNFERLAIVRILDENSTHCQIKVQDNRSSGWTQIRVKEAFCFNLSAYNRQLMTAREITAKTPYHFTKFGHVEALELNGCGKNLFDGEFTTGGNISEITGQDIAQSNTTRTNNFYAVKPNTSYIITNNQTTNVRAFYYDSSKNYISFVESSSLPQVTPDKCAFVRARFATIAAEQLIQIEQDTTPTDHQEYKESAPVKSTHTLRSVPSARDVLDVENRLRTERVKEYVLQSGDIAGIYESGGVALAYVEKSTLAGINDFINSEPLNISVGRKNWSENNSSLWVNNIEAYFTSSFSDRLFFIFDNGTTLDQAQADLAGTTILYERAEPVTKHIDINPNLLAYQDGTIWVETEKVIPEIYAEYPGNVAAQRDSNTERISTQIKNAYVSIPEYLEEEYDSQVFSVPSESVKGFAKSIELKGQTLFNDIKGGDFQDTSDWIGHFAGISASNNILTLLATTQYGALRPVTNLSMRIGNKYFVYAKVKGDSPEVMIATPQKNIYHSGSGEYEELHDIVSVTSDYIDSEYCFQVRDNRTFGWTDVLVDGNKGLYVINLTALGLKDKTEDDVLKMIASGYFEGLKVTGAVTVNSAGKNLINSDISLWEQGNISDISGVNIPSTSRLRTIGFINVKSNTSYSTTGQIAVRGYDKNNNFTQNFSLTSPFTTGVNTEKLRLVYIDSGDINILPKLSFQLEQGTTPTEYEPYKSSAQIHIANVGHRLPNGVQDKVYTQNGKWYREQNVGVHVLEGEDITGMYTGYTNTDVAKVNKSVDYIGFGSYNIGTGTFVLGGCTEDIVGNSTTENNIVSEGSFASFYVVTFPKGTSLSTAQADLAGKTILYQLATPITTELTANPNLLVQEDGTTYLDVDGITPITTIEYCKNKDAREEQNLIAKNVINNRLVDLSSTAINKGASLIGVKDIAGLTGSEVQTILESIKALLDTINVSLTTHTGSANPHSNHVKGDMTIHVQSTEPAGAVDGDIWIDTSV